jgi:hypothetical protein
MENPCDEVPDAQKPVLLHSVSPLGGWSYRHNFSEHVGPDSGFEPALFNEVHPDAKKVHKIILEMDKTKERSRAIEFHEDIHIACFFLFAPDIGTEYPKVGNTITFPEFWQVCPEILPDLINRSLFL